MDEEARSQELETSVISLHVALPIIPLSLIVAAIGYGLMQPEILRQKVNVFAVVWFILWCILLVGLLIAAFFSKMRIDKQGVSFRSPWVYLLGFKGFPVTFSFDEARIKARWRGRLFTINKGNKWTAILFYSFWVMPIKWKESSEIIRKLQGNSPSFSLHKESLQKTS